MNYPTDRVCLPMEPPFTVDVSLKQTPPTHPYELMLPAVYYEKPGKLREIKFGEEQSLQEYLQHELDLSRLDRIHNHLWLAGRPSVGARPLHRQLMIGRQIILTEQADLHLVWQDSRIYIKPIPEFLLDLPFWTEHLCQNHVLWQTARGFLLSYIWLIRSINDLRIAHHNGLLPIEIQWERWVLFSRSFLRSVNIETLESVNRRFQYGELRLNRLNWIYRMSLKYDPKEFIRGYMHKYNRYSVFMERNFAWIIGAFVYVTIVLTSMQVGLATDRLGKNERFQNASYGFAVFAITAPIVAFGVLAFFMVVVIFLNLQDALKLEEKKVNLASPYGVTFPGKGTV